MTGNMMTTTDKLLEEKAIERIVHDYAYFLDMNQHEEIAKLFVD